jgi:nucleotide-binding universal stress UspA family protein
MSVHTSQVVVAYDFSASGREALLRAVTLAARAPFHVLHVVCVIDPHGSIPAVPLTGPVTYQYAEKVQEALAAIIGDELRASNAADRIHFFVHARIGKAADEILAVAREVGADLIILGTKGLTGVERLVLGSIAERVVREAGCTVEVARPKTYNEVHLLEIKDVEAPHHPYVPPHRYSYESSRVHFRPGEWPLY